MDTEIENIIQKIMNNEINYQDALVWKNENKFNLWHITAQENYIAFEKLSNLVSKEQFAEKIKEKNSVGDNVAHTAAWAGKIDALKLIVKITQQNLDYTDEQNRNILMICIKNKDKKLIDYAIKNTEDFNHQDKHKQTILHYVQHFSDASTYQQIVKLGCDELLKNNLGKTPIMPIKQDDDSILDFIAQNKKKISFV